MRIKNELFVKWSVDGTLRDIEFIHELGFTARIKIALAVFHKLKLSQLYKYVNDNNFRANKITQTRCPS